MAKKRMSGVNVGRMSRGPIVIVSFLFGMLAFMGYLYHKYYRHFETHIIYLVYLMGGVSVLLFLVAIANPKDRRH